jgi:hypothetical protein
MGGFYGPGQPHCLLVRCVMESGLDLSATDGLTVSHRIGLEMKKLLSVLALGLSLSMGSAFAADAPAAPTKQQSKMKTCNADAKDKKGDERKAFMKECLSNKPAAAEPAMAAASGASTQQSKMKTCNVEAKGKKGDERKAFMKECLSK